MTFDDANAVSRAVLDGNGTSAFGGANIILTVLNACIEYENQFWDVQTSGIWKMTTKIWVYKGILGSSKIGSYTHAWKKKNNGTWKRHKADIWCDIHGVFRSTNCVAESSKDGSKYRHLFRKVQKTKSKWR